MYLAATYTGERLDEILLRENADPGEMLAWERKEESLLQTEELPASSFLIWWRWREGTSTWPSLLSIFSSFVFWDHLPQRLNSANPQSKLCSLHFCESGQNAEGQFNVDLFLLSLFCTDRNHVRFRIHTDWEGVWSGLYTQIWAEVEQVPLALLSYWFNFSVICCTQEHQSCQSGLDRWNIWAPVIFR